MGVSSRTAQRMGLQRGSRWRQTSCTPTPPLQGITPGGTRPPAPGSSSPCAR
uniref:Uncharacterized protein n=1 Tax=Anguilla anguilla TaxID=7936 RepID=A0A0E9TRA8_ANGAN